MSARVGTVLVVVSIAASLAGCGRDMNDLEQWVEEMKARPAARIDPLPQIQPYETFTYAPQDRRSPFTPSRMQAAAGAGDGISPDPSRRREYLEEFPLDTLRMVGTVTMGGETYALIRTQDRAVHRVRVGNHLGQNHGRVVAITDTAVRLVEIIPDGMGGWAERQAAIALSE